MGRHPKNCNCEHCEMDKKLDSNTKKPEQKDSNLDSRLKDLEREFGMKKASEIIIEPKIRTGIYAFDYVLSGGISQCEGGHKIELYGRESSGKTTLAMKVVAKFQELGKSCVWINAENNLDTLWAEMNGVKPDKLLVTKPETLESAGDMIINLVGKVDLIVIDSISMLLPAEELEGGLEEKHMASQAKVNAPFCRKLLQQYKDSKTVIIFINQMREKVGVMYGNPETTSGGRAIRHMYDSRIEIRKGKPIEEGTGDNKEIIGHEIIMRCTKNKKGSAYLQSIVDFYSIAKFDQRKSLFFAGLKYMIIKREGNTYSFKNISAVGQEKFYEKLDDKLLGELEEEIWKVQK